MPRFVKDPVTGKWVKPDAASSAGAAGSAPPNAADAAPAAEPGTSAGAAPRKASSDADADARRGSRKASVGFSLVSPASSLAPEVLRAPVRLEGEMQKKPTSGFLRPWQSRYFVLRGEQLLRFPRAAAAAAAGDAPDAVMRMADVSTVELADGDDRGLRLAIRGGGHVLLRCADAAAALQWRDALRARGAPAAGPTPSLHQRRFLYCFVLFVAAIFGLLVALLVVLLVFQILRVAGSVAHYTLWNIIPPAAFCAIVARGLTRWAPAFIERSAQAVAERQQEELQRRTSDGRAGASVPMDTDTPATPTRDAPRETTRADESGATDPDGWRAQGHFESTISRCHAAAAHTSHSHGATAGDMLDVLAELHEQLRSNPTLHTQGNRQRLVAMAEVCRNASEGRLWPRVVAQQFGRLLREMSLLRQITRTLRDRGPAVAQ